MTERIRKGPIGEIRAAVAAEEIITDEFASRLNAVAGKLPDGTLLEALLLHKYVNTTSPKRVSVIPPELLSWVNLYHNLDPNEKGQLTISLRHTFRHKEVLFRNFRTLDDIRKAKASDIRDNCRGMGDLRANFIKAVFEPLDHE